MFKNLTNFANLLRNAGQMTTKLQEMKAELQRRRVHGSSADGEITTTFNGLGQVESIRIGEALIDPSRRDELESHLASAVNDGIRQARALHIESLKKLTGDLEIPGLDKLIAELAE
jgi:nucleoid-associated protein EbfC